MMDLLENYEHIYSPTRQNTDRETDMYRQWFLTYLLHDLSPDGGTYPTILLCKLLAVTRETKVTLSNRTKSKK